MTSTGSLPCAIALATVLLVPCARAQDQGFIPAPGRVDVAYDAKHEVLYISGGSQVLRFDMQAKQFLAPITLGGLTWGMDISGDGKELAVANHARGALLVFVDLIDLSNLKPKRVAFSRDTLEGGTNAVAFDRLGYLLVSGNPDYGCSPLPPLRRYERTTKETVVTGHLSGSALLTPAAAREWIAVAEENSSAGPWGSYMVGGDYRSTHFLDHEANDIGISPDGSQIAIAAGSAYVFNDFAQVAVIGTYPTGPLGVAYSPTKPSVYFPMNQSNTIVEYDTTTMSVIGTLQTPGTFNVTGIGEPFVEGRTKVSSDGRWLFSTLGDGVFYTSLSAN